ncbi:hypothetical protein ACI65C_006089 [Semiaphis heraclei]
MSTLSDPGTTWYFLSDEQEPFLELPLRECTADQIRAKLEFLEKNILLLKCECEVIELNSIKSQPELAVTNKIDVSWMPYDIKPEEHILSLVPPKVSKLSREKLRQSAILSKKSVLGSIYSVVNSAIKMNKISIHQVIAEVEKALITMDEYFDKINNTMIKSLDKIEYETENIDLEIHRQLQNIETFRANVLVAGVNRLTKRIPADKYQKFIKKKLMSSTIYLNDLQFKITDAITEEQTLHERYVTSKHIRDTVFETDMHNVRMMNKKLLKEQIEITTKNKELKQHLSVVRQDYLKKKYDSEKFELSLDLPLLDAEIKRYRNKLLRLPAVVEIHDNYRNDIDNDDDSNDSYGLNEIETIPSKTLNKPVMTFQNLYDFKMTSIWAFLIGMLTAFGFMFIFWIILYKGISKDTTKDKTLQPQNDKPTTICSCINRYCCKGNKEVLSLYMLVLARAELIDDDDDDESNAKRFPFHRRKRNTRTGRPSHRARLALSLIHNYCVVPCSYSPFSASRHWPVVNSNTINSQLARRHKAA